MSYSHTDASSPYGRFLAHCAKGELAFQRAADGRAIFHPRLVAPGDGGPLTWRISAGQGAVHSVTVVRRRGETPFALALIDLDEGFRMMSRVDAADPAAVRIGDRVAVAFRPLAEGEAPLPVFTPAEDRA